MPSAAGLSATYGGYQQARKADNQIEQGDIANQQSRIAQEGEAAWGNTIPVLQQMLQPGASAMPPQGGPAPQAPPPGQPSQPMQRGPQPQMLGAPPPPNDPTWSAGPSGPVPPQGASAAPSPAGGPPPMGGMGGQPQAGRLDLHTVMGAVVKANPGAKPAVIAAAVAKALPLMTAQSQMDYKNLMVQLSAGRLNEATAHHAETEANAAARTGNQTTDINSKVERRNAQTEQGNERLGLQKGREARLAGQAEIRNDQRYQQLDLQKRALETRIQQGGDRAAVSEWRAIVDAQHKRALEIIQSGKNSVGVMDPAERKALVDEQNAFYKQQIESMKKGPAPAKATDRPPPSGPPGQPGAAPAATAGTPVKVATPQEAQALKPGTPYITPDGQQYTR